MKLPFVQFLKDLSVATDRAKATFLYRLIMSSSPSLCRTVIKYSTWRIQNCEEEKEREVKFVLQGDEVL
jgi:hypothetical protein